MTLSRVIYWDIDGTLLTTGRAGVPALEDGAEAVLGWRPDLSGMRTAGLTDRMIAREILAGAGHPADEAAQWELLRVYVEALPDRLAARRGSVLPGVRQTLDELAGNPSVLNVLLTGNLSAGAAAKLRSYGLDHHFSMGTFAEDGRERTEIARVAVSRVERRHGLLASDGILVGDTTYDVRAGRDVGLRVVAVASDPAAREELASAQPWWLVEMVPRAAALLERMADVNATAWEAS